MWVQSTERDGTPRACSASASASQAGRSQADRLIVAFVSHAESTPTNNWVQFGLLRVGIWGITVWCFPPVGELSDVLRKAVPMKSRVGGRRSISSKGPTKFGRFSPVRVVSTRVGPSLAGTSDGKAEGLFSRPLFLRSMSSSDEASAPLAAAVTAFARACRAQVHPLSDHTSGLMKATIPGMLMSMIGPQSGTPPAAQLDALETLKVIASRVLSSDAAWHTGVTSSLVTILKLVTGKEEKDRLVAAEYTPLVAPAIEVLTAVAKTGRKGQQLASAAAVPLVSLLRSPLPAKEASSSAAQSSLSTASTEEEELASYTILLCAVRALAALCKSLTETQLLVRDAGGVPAVVELLEREPPLSAFAAACLAALAADKENCDAIYEAQGLGRLIKLLHEPSPLVAAEAAHALKAVAFRSVVDRDTIRDEGGIPALVALLTKGLHSKGGSDEHAEPAMWAAGALRHMAYTNVANSDAIREAGGIAPLLALIRKRLADDDASHAKTHEETVLDACGCLWNLTEHSPPNCLALLEAEGGVSALVGLLARDARAFGAGASEETTPEPLWRLAENALVNLIEKSDSPNYPPHAHSVAIAAAAAAMAADPPVAVAADPAAAEGPQGAGEQPAAGEGGGAMPRVVADSAPGAAEVGGAGPGGGAAYGGGAHGGGAHGGAIAPAHLARNPDAASWRRSVSGARRATGEIVSAAQAAGLLLKDQPPRLPARLLASLQRQLEPRLEFAQEGSDERALCVPSHQPAYRARPAAARPLCPPCSHTSLLVPTPLGSLPPLPPSRLPPRRAAAARGRSRTPPPSAFRRNGSRRRAAASRRLRRPQSGGRSGRPSA